MNQRSGLRVCHLTSVHPPTDVRVFMKECRTLAAAGFDVHLVTPGNGESHLADGVQVHGVPPAGGGRLRRMSLGVLRVARRAAALDARLYHFHDPELLPVGLWLLARGRRVIYDAHEDLPRDLLSKAYLGPWRRFLVGPVERLENLAARRVSAVVTATPTIGRRFQAINRRTVVANNYPLPEEVVAKDGGLGFDARPADVAYTGVISEMRGLFEMVRAMELVTVPGARLQLAGRFGAAAERDRAARAPGWSGVCEHGHVSRTRMGELLGRVRAGLLLYHPHPNCVDAQPNKLYEYLGAGLPVIASDFPLWRELIEGTRCGMLVNPLDPAAIAAAIDYLLRNPLEAEAMGRRGRLLVEEKCNWAPEGRKLVGLYDELLGVAADAAARPDGVR